MTILLISVSRARKAFHIHFRLIVWIQLQWNVFLHVLRYVQGPKIDIALTTRIFDLGNARVDVLLRAQNAPYVHIQALAGDRAQEAPILVRKAVGPTLTVAPVMDLVLVHAHQDIRVIILTDRASIMIVDGNQRHLQTLNSEQTYSEAQGFVGSKSSLPREWAKSTIPKSLSRDLVNWAALGISQEESRSIQDSFKLTFEKESTLDGPPSQKNFLLQSSRG